jgi:hypothetical protein
MATLVPVGPRSPDPTPVWVDASAHLGTAGAGELTASGGSKPVQGEETVQRKPGVRRVSMRLDRLPLGREIADFKNGGDNRARISVLRRFE